MKHCLFALFALLLASTAHAGGDTSHDDFLNDAIRPGLGATMSFDAMPQVAVPAVTQAPATRPALPAVRAPGYDKRQAAAYNKLIDKIAREHKLDPQFLHAIVTVESGYNPGAISPKGALGLMQLMPDTAARFGVSDPADPVQSLRGGARYLSWLKQYFKQDMTLVIAAYNAGEGAVGKYRNTIPPYPETRDYVAKVLASYEMRTGQSLLQAPATTQRPRAGYPPAVPL